MVGGCEPLNLERVRTRQRHHDRRDLCPPRRRGPPGGHGGRLRAPGRGPRGIARRVRAERRRGRGHGTKRAHGSAGRLRALGARFATPRHAEGFSGSPFASIGDPPATLARRNRAPLLKGLSVTAPPPRLPQDRSAGVVVVRLPGTRGSRPPGRAANPRSHPTSCPPCPPPPPVVEVCTDRRDHGNVEALVKEGVTDENRSKVVAAIRKHAQACVIC